MGSSLFRFSLEKHNSAEQEIRYIGYPVRFEYENTIRFLKFSNKYITAIFFIFFEIIFLVELQ